MVLVKKKLINKRMTIGNIAEEHPEVIETMLKHGLHCIGCHVSPYETIEQGSMGHGMSKKEVEKMVKEMNEILIKKKKK